MAEHPLIFSAPMVRAILEDRKTVTRRLSKNSNFYMGWKKGDRVWVRESFSDTWELGDYPGEKFYKATYLEDWKYHNPKPETWDVRWKPSIHMPRRASRITLELTADVRREKLNIGDVNYRAEGFLSQVEFFNLWDKMHPDNTWKMNPIVSVIEFRKARA